MPPPDMQNDGTIFLHLGVHKTGTTSLQRLLAGCHDRLRARGICEFSVHSPCGPAYRAFRSVFTKVRDRILAGAQLGEDDKLAAALEAAREEAQMLLDGCDGRGVVISDENMLGPPIGQLRARGYWEHRFYPKAQPISQALAAVFPDQEIVPILCRRDAPDLVESLYGNSIQGLSFAGNIDEFLDRIDVGSIDYARLDRSVATGFNEPVAWLDFASIRERDGEGLTRAFFELIGAGDLDIPRIERSNSRYNDAQVRQARAYAAQAPEGKERRRLAREVRRMAVPGDACYGETRLSEEQRAAIEAKAPG